MRPTPLTNHFALRSSLTLALLLGVLSGCEESAVEDSADAGEATCDAERFAEPCTLENGEAGVCAYNGWSYRCYERRGRPCRFPRDQDCTIDPCQLNSMCGTADAVVPYEQCYDGPSLLEDGDPCAIGDREGTCSEGTCTF